MADSILIAYATRSGSTREVTEKIAATLWERGLTVDVAARQTSSDAGRLPGGGGWRAAVDNQFVHSTSR